MDDDQTSKFSGIVGRVLSGSISLSTLLSGVVLGVVLLAASFVFTRLGATELSLAFNQIVIALALARFSLNGRWGEWSGTIFSQNGGNWGETASVAGRYLALTLVWLAPLFVMGLNPEQSMQALAMALSGMGGGAVVDVMMLYVAGMLLTPPIFLVASVGAGSFSDLVRLDHWRGLFGGRLGDLFTIYVVYLGALVLVIFFAMPALVMVLLKDPDLGMALAWLILSFVLGLAVNLLGRLCGFFACEGEEHGSHAHTPVPQRRQAGTARQPATTSRPTATSVLTTPAAVGDGGGSTVILPSPVSDTAAAATDPLDADPGSATMVMQRPEWAKGGEAGDDPAPIPVAGAESAPLAALTDLDGASGGEPDPSVKPPLLDAAGPVKIARQKFQRQPAEGIAMLEELHEHHAPHPAVLHTLCVMHQKTGDKARAVTLAVQGIPVCIERGNLPMAAQLFRAFRPDLGLVDCSRDQLVALAGALTQMEDTRNAATVYSFILRQDAGESRAIKGLLQLADSQVRQEEHPRDAMQIYLFLLERCPASPLVDFMREGLAAAEKKLQQS